MPNTPRQGRNTLASPFLPPFSLLQCFSLAEANQNPGSLGNSWWESTLTPPYDADQGRRAESGSESRQANDWHVPLIPLQLQLIIKHSRIFMIPSGKLFYHLHLDSASAFCKTSWDVFPSVKSADTSVSVSYTSPGLQKFFVKSLCVVPVTRVL